MSTSNCLMTAVVIVEQISANSEFLFHDSPWQFTCRDRMAIIVGQPPNDLGAFHQQQRSFQFSTRRIESTN